MTERQFSDGALIYRQGDPADGVYRVRSGRVRLRRGSGDRVGTGDLGVDSVFGDDGFLTGGTRETDAVAVGDVEVEFLRRNEFLAILSVQQHFPGDSDPDTAGVRPAVPAPAIRLVLDGRRLRTALGVDEIAVHELPFRIGRSASGEGKDTYDDVSLAIDDVRPFNLSRRHFSIERENGTLVVRDCGSYHGTTLNGQILGGDGRPLSAPLMAGESELVAGRSDSPFRFRIFVQ